MRIWFQRLLTQFINWVTPAYRTRMVKESLPKTLDPKTVYVVEEDGYLEHASLICPCGCNEVLHMNLLPDADPVWKLIRHNDGTVSLYPSVWRQRGCYSHFWFKKGRVLWCQRTEHLSQQTSNSLNVRL